MKRGNLWRSRSPARKRIRKSFGQNRTKWRQLPNLIEVQKSLLRSRSSTARRGKGYQHDVGMTEVFKSVFPIHDFSERSSWNSSTTSSKTPKYDVEECQQRGMTYGAPLKVTLRLVVWDVDEDTGARSIRDIKEQDVYMGDMPLMTGKGTFVVNGTERVIVSQMHRSPGVFLRPRQGQDAFLGQVPVCRAGDPVSRVLARFRIRCQGSRAMSGSIGAANCRRRLCLWRWMSAATEAARVPNWRPKGAS